MTITVGQPCGHSAWFGVEISQPTYLPAHLLVFCARQVILKTDLYFMDWRYSLSFEEKSLDFTASLLAVS